ncbi:DNA-3-methyladenine glycosylase I [Megasphaera paucivorans]|uniref:DNA-3-methyladenine glycosylase I n=1 Tax=Megasphaera paucivorans TaxID=349095 RepID=UPI003D07AF17
MRKQQVVTSSHVQRCPWAEKNLLLRQYHDEEWGVPNYDERYIFEMLSLEGAQAGLSWITILSKRNAYRAAFHDFDIQRCAEMNNDELERIITDYGIVKNRKKVYSVRQNALAVIQIQKEYGSFSSYLWDYTDNHIIKGDWEKESSIPDKNDISEKISRDLKKRGFVFVGPVIIYSFLQAIGIINDHVIDCCFNRLI